MIIIACLPFATQLEGKYAAVSTYFIKQKKKGEKVGKIWLAVDFSRSCAPIFALVRYLRALNPVIGYFYYFHFQLAQFIFGRLGVCFFLGGGIWSCENQKLSGISSVGKLFYIYSIIGGVRARKADKIWLFICGAFSAGKGDAVDWNRYFHECNKIYCDFIRLLTLHW